MSLCPVFKRTQLKKICFLTQSRPYIILGHRESKVIDYGSKTQVRGVRGSGAGKGGGAGGSIRESGGSLGKFGAANEEGYFFQKQLEQLRELKEKLKLQKKDTKDDEAGKNKR